MGWICLEQVKRKARKDHRCYLCDKVIQKGSTYTFRSGVNEGEGFGNMKMHNECEELSESIYGRDELMWEVHDPSEFLCILKEQKEVV